MTDTSVKYYASTMSGAPALSGEVGKLIAVLDACLVNGFGSVTLSSLVVASNVATGTVSGGHNFAMVGNTGPVITIAGATPSGLNGEWRVTVTSSTEFTFVTTGISDQTATGTITAKRSPAGFSVAFSSTNDKSWRSDNVAGSRPYFRVLDSTGYEKIAIIALYESMTAWDTGTNGYGMYLEKSATQNSTAREWHLFADDKAFHLIVTNGGIRSGMFFGDIITYKAADAYHGCLVANNTNDGSNNHLYYTLNTANGHVVTRSYTQAGLCQLVRFLSCGNASYMGSVGVTHPNAVDSILTVWPVVIFEELSPYVIRGMWPGAYSPLIQYSTISDATVVSGDKDLMVMVFSSGAVAYDITGPWR
ncbi:MAG: hypothetical protein NHG36_20090 [Chromatiaceae bacterium]|nr:hypothetical protein [Candidatus Thioaporhodococcus sediminis]